MRFAHIFTFAVAATATPVPGLEVSTEPTKTLETRQANNFANAISGAIGAASTAISTSLDSIDTALAQAGGAINVDVQAIIEANLNTIAGALQNGTAAIADAIAAGGGNIGNIVAGFTTGQIAQVVNAANQLVTLLSNLGARLTIIVNGVNGISPAVLAALQSELDAIQAAVQPFVGPFAGVVDAVRQVSVIASLALTGFSTAVPGLVGIINNLINGL